MSCKGYLLGILVSRRLFLVGLCVSVLSSVVPCSLLQLLKQAYVACCSLCVQDLCCRPCYSDSFLPARSSHTQAVSLKSLFPELDLVVIVHRKSEAARAAGFWVVHDLVEVS